MGNEKESDAGDVAPAGNAERVPGMGAPLKELGAAAVSAAETAEDAAKQREKSIAESFVDQLGGDPARDIPETIVLFQE